MGNSTEELHYAYWKDPESRKLKKKYIGSHMPDNKVRPMILIRLHKISQELVFLCNHTTEGLQVS